MADEGGDPKDSGAPGAPVRRPYASPDIAWEEPLEDRPHLIAACAQRPGEDDPCNASPTS
jgi:hypothetical protein